MNESKELRRLSPGKRLNIALTVIRNARIRIQARRIYENEIAGASIFWDVADRQIEFIADDWEIIIRERKS